MPPIQLPMANDMLTPEQQTAYLEDLADPDITPDVAARNVGLTGTKMRGLRKRDHEWDARCRTVEEDRKMARAVAVIEEAHARGKVSDRILEVLLATYGPMVEPAFAHLRRDRMRADVNVTGIQIQIDRDSFDHLSLAEKKKLREILGALEARMIEPHPDIEAA